MSKDKVLTSLRKALHALGNRHHIFILLPGLIRLALERCLSQADSLETARCQIKKISDDLSNLEAAGKEADTILKNIKQALYDRVDPDAVVVDNSDIDISGGKND